MGSPLASFLANWFIASKENTQLKNNDKTKPIFYTRYVDDIFVLMENNQKKKRKEGYLTKLTSTFSI